MPTKELHLPSPHPDTFTHRGCSELLKHVPLVRGWSFDDENTVVVDDVLSVIDVGSHVMVLVSIPNVGATIPACSLPARLAQEKGETYYGSTYVDHMLPLDLVTKRASFNDNTIRPAITIGIHYYLNGTARQEGVNIFLSSLHNQRQVSYSEANELMRNGSMGGDAEMLKKLSAIVKFRKRVVDREEMTIEEVMALTGAHHPRSITSSHKLVAYFMVLAGRSVAEFARAQGIPALYRVHACDLLAQYSASPGTHYDLGNVWYARATSPLRRFADFVNISNLSAYLTAMMYGRAPEYPYPGLILPTLALHLNRREQECEGNNVIV